jgi:hypothetical protein
MSPLGATSPSRHTDQSPTTTAERGPAADGTTGIVAPQPALRNLPAALTRVAAHTGFKRRGEGRAGEARSPATIVLSDILSCLVRNVLTGAATPGLQPG